MKLVLLGAPGVGKGTQAIKLAQTFGLAHISTGEMLRQAVQAGSELGERAKSIMDAGQLIPDELMVELIEKRVSEKDCELGYILDGFPRTVPQAEALEQLLSSRGVALSGVILFAAPREELVARLAHRRSAEARADDSAQVQEQRLKVYEEQTAPLIDYYQKRDMLKEVDALGDIEVVFARARSVLENLS